jgi:transposase
LSAFDDLTVPDALQLLGAAPDPMSAARRSIGQVTAALKRARRRNVAQKAEAIHIALRQQLGQPAVVTAAYAATVRAQVAILTTLNTEFKNMEAQVEAHFGKHPDAEVYLSQPGLGVVLGARVLAEFGDDRNRYADAKARKSYAAPARSPASPARRR